MEGYSLRGALICAAILLVAAFGNGCGSGEDVAQGEETDAATASALERVELDALQTYQWYLEGEAFQLLKMTEQLQEAIARGDESEADFFYGRARVLYGHIAPGARLFPALEKRINGYEEEFSNGEFSGFHKIEQVLFGQETTKGLDQVTSQLVADLRQLQQTFEEAELEAIPIAEAASDLIQEVSDKWPPGKLQPHAHLDLVDISAQVEGAQRAYQAVSPLMQISNLGLDADVELKFIYCYEMLEGRGTPARGIPVPEPNAGALFIPYGDMNELDIEEIAEPIDELAEVLHKVPARLTS